jgi:hypothetical protein
LPLGRGFYADCRLVASRHSLMRVPDLAPPRTRSRVTRNPALPKGPVGCCLSPAAAATSMPLDREAEIERDGRPHHRPQPARQGWSSPPGRRASGHDRGRRPENLHARGGGCFPQAARHRRLLGDVVRPLQAAHADPREGCVRRRRPAKAGENRHRRQSLSRAAACAARPTAAIGPHSRRFLAGTDR